MAIKTPDVALDEALTFPDGSPERIMGVMRLYFRGVDAMDKAVAAGGERRDEWERVMRRVIREGICGQT